MRTIEEIPMSPIQTIDPGVAEARQLVAVTLASGLLAIIGPCAQTEAEATIRNEMQETASVTDRLLRIQGLYRTPPWKPRTKKEDWHGLETTNAALALELIKAGSQEYAHIAIELGLDHHHDVYGSHLTFGWIGGRNIDHRRLQEQIALSDPSLPLGIKNGLDGNIDVAIDVAADLRRLRGEGAPILPIYRGGESAQTPEAWEKVYKRALEVTEGQLIVDVAHGGEMAHDPAGMFKKSVAGQIACLDHVIDLLKQDYRPAGVMIEASDTPSPTDPTIPFETALQKVSVMEQIINEGSTA